MLQLLLLITVSVLIAGCSHPTADLETVSFVDLNRYTGQWYEIARYENSFEKGCIGASAQYTIKDDSIEVLNSCYNEAGEITSEAKGDVKAVAESGNAKLKVSFFWPFYGNYWVIDLADDYRYSVIGEPSRKYFWILSRSPKMSDTDKQHILSLLPSLGYDPKMLYWTQMPNHFVPQSR